MKIVYLLTLCLFAACCNNRNETMTALLNEKKILADSLNMAHNYEGFYLDKAKAAIKEKTDGSAQLPDLMADSSSYYFGVQLRLRDEIKSVDFSIDSLSKMK